MDTDHIQSVEVRQIGSNRLSESLDRNPLLHIAVSMAKKPPGTCLGAHCDLKLLSCCLNDAHCDACALSCAVPDNVIPFLRITVPVPQSVVVLWSLTQ